MDNPVTSTIGTRYNADGSSEASVGDDGTLLYFSGQGWPTHLQVAPFARVHVDGDTYYAWSAQNPRLRITGGEIVGPDGEREHIADALRRTLAVDDPRWRDSIPKPFFT